jgi:formaldehyde-activating enzyme
VPTTELKDLRQANMIYGPVQSAVAKAVVDKLSEGVIPKKKMQTDVMFVQAAIHPQALDRRILHHNAYMATCIAIDKAFAGNDSHFGSAKKALAEEVK